MFTVSREQKELSAPHRPVALKPSSRLYAVASSLIRAGSLSSQSAQIQSFEIDSHHPDLIGCERANMRTIDYFLRALCRFLARRGPQFCRLSTSSRSIPRSPLNTTVNLQDTTHTATTALPTLLVALSKPWLVSTLLCPSRGNDCGCPERSLSSSAGSTSLPLSRIHCTGSLHHSLSPWKDLQQVLQDIGMVSLA